MQKISLNGEWSLCGFDEPQQDLPAFLAGLESHPTTPAQVPANVELDLYRTWMKQIAELSQPFSFWMSDLA